MPHKKGFLYSQFTRFGSPNTNRTGMKTLFVPRIGNIMGLVFGLRGMLIYTKTYLMTTYKDEWLFEAIEQIKVRKILYRLFLNHPVSRSVKKILLGHQA